MSKRRYFGWRYTCSWYLKNSWCRGISRYLVREVQSVYKLQGVYINDKHIETIARQMLQKVLVKDPGDSNLISGEQIQKKSLLD